MYPGTEYTVLSLPWILSLDFQGKARSALVWKKSLHIACASLSALSPLVFHPRNPHIYCHHAQTPETALFAIPGYISIVIPTLHFQWALSPLFVASVDVFPVSTALIGLLQVEGHLMVLPNDEDICEKGDTNKCFYFSTEKFYTYKSNNLCELSLQI